MTKVVVQERDRIAGRKVLAVGLSSLAVFAVGVALAGWMLAVRTRRLLPQGPPPLPRLAGQSEIGIVDQSLFEQRQTLLDGQRRRLDTYGWIDRAGGRVHIPIERAMQMVLEEARK